MCLFSNIPSSAWGLRECKPSVHHLGPKCEQQLSIYALARHSRAEGDIRQELILLITHGLTQLLDVYTNLFDVYTNLFDVYTNLFMTLASFGGDLAIPIFLLSVLLLDS